MTQAGREAFLECAKNVMSLQGSKRINDSRQDDKDLIANLRIATEKEMEDQHVQRLLNLRLDRMTTKHGTEFVKDIEDRAIFLFSKNEKRILPPTTNLKLTISDRPKSSPTEQRNKPKFRSSQTTKTKLLFYFHQKDKALSP